MAYTRVNWVNEPSTATPINATNLNKMDAGIAELGEQTLLGQSADGITTYPTAIGVYRVTATKPSGLPTYASSYGTLIIYGNGYWGHIYIGSGNDVWMTRTTTLSSAPSETAWQQVSSNLMSTRSETDLNQITQAGTWRLSAKPTANFPTVLGSTGDQFINALLDVTGLGADMITQRITVTNNSGYPTHAGRTYQRVRRNATGDWSDWSEIVQSKTFTPVGLASYSEDFNNLTEAGFYPRIFSSASQNGPGFHCYLMVIASPKTESGNLSYVTQIAISATSNAIATRTYYNNSWGQWRWTMASFRVATLSNTDIVDTTVVTSLIGDVYVTGKVVEVNFSFTTTGTGKATIQLNGSGVMPTCHGVSSSYTRPRCVCRPRSTDANAPTMVAEINGDHIDIFTNGVAGTYMGSIHYMMG